MYILASTCTRAFSLDPDFVRDTGLMNLTLYILANRRNKILICYETKYFDSLCYQLQCPTTIVPFFGDQFFWGDRIHQKGLGPEPIPIAQLSVDALSSAIRFMLQPEVFVIFRLYASTALFCWAIIFWFPSVWTCIFYVRSHLGYFPTMSCSSSIFCGVNTLLELLFQTEKWIMNIEMRDENTLLWYRSMLIVLSSIKLYCFQVKSRVMELAKLIENEDGVASAVDAFHRHLPHERPIPPASPEQKESENDEYSNPIQWFFSLIGKFCCRVCS